MKKFTLSFFVIGLSVVYGLYQNSWSTQYATNTVPSQIKKTTTSKNNTPTVAVTIPKTTAPASVPVVVKPPVVAVKPKGQYVDGTYVGAGADAYYGTVQVQVSIQNGKLTDVAFLQYPNDRNNSIRINNRAMPVLKSEAIQAQNANVRFVSGATDTSMAFQQSLQDALSQALA